MGTPNSYHLLRLVRNLRTGRNQPVAAIQALAAKIRQERLARQAAESPAAEQAPKEKPDHEGPA